MKRHGIHDADQARCAEKTPGGLPARSQSGTDRNVRPVAGYAAGAHEEVMFVDDAGSVHIAWVNGSTSAAIHGADRIRRID